MNLLDMEGLSSFKSKNDALYASQVDVTEFSTGAKLLIDTATRDWQIAKGKISSMSNTASTYEDTINSINSQISNNEKSNYYEVPWPFVQIESPDLLYSVPEELSSFYGIIILFCSKSPDDDGFLWDQFRNGGFTWVPMTSADPTCIKCNKGTDTNTLFVKHGGEMTALALPLHPGIRDDVDVSIPVTMVYSMPVDTKLVITQNTVPVCGAQGVLDIESPYMGSWLNLTGEVLIRDAEELVPFEFTLKGNQIFYEAYFTDGTIVFKLQFPEGNARGSLTTRVDVETTT